MMEPVVLPANQPPQFYRGGTRIAAFRGTQPASAFEPEDWIASTVSLHGGTLGATALANGRLLRTDMCEHPLDYFGEEHVSRLGPNPGLLVKLLDTGERLPVHAHPDRQFAHQHLGCRFGKTEAWLVLETEGPDPHVYFGFSREVSAGDIAGWFENQDATQILGAMNRHAVEPGDAILVPAGVPHAIGEGIFLAELQEPTDFSVMLEWQHFAMPERAAGQLGLDRDEALRCFDRSAWSPARMAGCARRHREAFAGALASDQLLPPQADQFFRAELVRGGAGARLEPGYGVLIVTAGTGALTTKLSRTPVRRGSTVLVPWSAGVVALDGDFTALRCLPGISAGSRDS
jgi:mannose-6-phosphate isomerase